MRRRRVQQSCARYFSSATPSDAVQCDIDVAWVTPWSLFVGIAGLLEWEIDIARHLADAADERDRRAVAGRGVDQPGGAGCAGPSRWPDAGRRTGPAIRNCPERPAIHDRPQAGVGGGSARARCCGAWTSDRLDRCIAQARLAGFRPPQRGLFVVGSGHFETFDAGRHRCRRAHCLDRLTRGRRP